MKAESTSGELWQAFYQKGDLTWWKEEYATFQYVQNFLQSEWIQRLLSLGGIKNKKGARILEAGCGTGLYAVSLASLGFSVDAFDYNKEAVAMATKLAEKIKQ